MNEAQFWELVQRVHDAAGDDMDRKCEVLKAEIGMLSKNDANDFAILFDTMMDKAYSYKLWGAAYVINGGCGDDTFNDFRSSLISRGRSCFERATADPDSLADDRLTRLRGFTKGINTPWVTESRPSPECDLGVAIHVQIVRPERRGSKMIFPNYSLGYMRSFT